MNSDKKQRTRKQHFVPKCYLKGFAFADANTRKDTWVWVYKKGNQEAPQKCSIKKIAWILDYYEDEEKDNRVEDLLSEIENQVCPIIQNLQISVESEINMKPEDKSVLACFIALLFTRNPAFRDVAKNIREKMVELYADHLFENDKEFKQIIESNPMVKERWVAGEIKPIIHEWATLPEMMYIAKCLKWSFLSKNWHFIIPPKGEYLITSDNPVYFDNAFEPIAGPAHPGSEVIIHLRKDLALVITPCLYDMKVFPMNSQTLKKFNRGVARAALESIYTNTESQGLSRMIAKPKVSPVK